MDIRLHRLEPFLVSHAKTLLFIDNDQAEPLKFDGFREQGMSADDNIDFAAGQAFFGFLGFCRWYQSG